MKIAHLIVGGDVSGGQKVCKQIIDASIKRGDEIVVVSPYDGDFTQILLKEGIPVYYIPFKKTYHFSNAFKFSSLLKKENIDLVHTHAMVSANIQARLGATLAGVPIIAHIHIPNKFRDHFLIQVYQRLFDNLTAYLCKKIITISHSTREDLDVQGISKDRVDVIHNGIDLNKCQFLRSREAVLEEFGIEVDCKVIGTVGRLCPIKGQKEFILAASQLIKQNKDYRFIIVGKDLEENGAYEKELRDLVSQLNLNSCIFFTGHRSDIYDLMNSFNCFVLPSKLEGLPITILEAMALKKPVVATDVGGVCELVADKETGLLIPPNDVSSLCKAITQIGGDAPKGTEMGLRGYQRVKDFFSESQMVDKILKLYDQMNIKGSKS